MGFLDDHIKIIQVDLGGPRMNRYIVRARRMGATDTDPGWSTRLHGLRPVGDRLHGGRMNDLPPRRAPVICSWWALCENPAATTEPHPILGDVPICARCQAKLRAMEGE